jgi:hypothetical protein
LPPSGGRRASVAFDAELLEFAEELHLRIENASSLRKQDMMFAPS